MQSAVSPFTVRDVRRPTSHALVVRFEGLLCHIALHMLFCQVIVADCHEL